MAVTLNANSSTGFIATSDTSSILQLQTGGTTAVTVDASQNVTLAGTLTATGVTTVPAGTAAAPAITTTGDTNTGIFFPAADTIAFAEGGTEAMRIDSSGNVGIGTTSPANKLDVVASGDVAKFGNTKKLFVSTDSAGFGLFSAASQANTGIYASDTSNFMYFATSSTERARIDSSGGFTIQGTTASGAFLWVKSGAYLGASGSSSAFVSQSSTGGGTTTYYIGNASITTVSDVRLKENIVDTQRNATEIVSQLRVVDHTWNDPSDQCENNRNSRGTWMGLIAQEAQPVIPWLVNKPTADVDENGDPQYWHMDYGYAVPLLIKAIQEQQALITQLQADVAALKGTTP